MDYKDLINVKNKRHIQLKIWPEIMDDYMSFFPFERIGDSKANPVDLDFSNVTKVYSSGLNILLIQLLKVIRESANRKWIYNEPVDNTIGEKIHALGLHKILNENVLNQLLIWTDRNSDRGNTELIYKFNETQITSYPIFELDFKRAKNKRALVENFRETLFEKLSFLNTDYKIKIHKLIQVLNEMAKNTADHTNENAYFGLDILISNETLKIKFSFGDTGIGILRNVRKAILQDTEYHQRAEHLGIVEIYRLALTPGYTTLPDSNVNRGIGMTIICDLSKDFGLELSAFDGQSRGFLSKVDEVTDSELRRIFYSLNKNTGFYYYGELTHKI